MAGRDADRAQTVGEPDRQLPTDTHRLGRSAAPTPGRDRERLDSVPQRRSGGLDRSELGLEHVRPPHTRAAQRLRAASRDPVASRAPPPAVGQAAARASDTHPRPGPEAAPRRSPPRYCAAAAQTTPARACVASQRRQHARRGRRTKRTPRCSIRRSHARNPSGRAPSDSPGTPPAGFQLGLHRSLAHARDNTEDRLLAHHARSLPDRYRAGEGRLVWETNTMRLTPP